MTKVYYDLRPVDTENVIKTRNRIRLSAFLNIFGVLVYLSINSSFKQTHASWAHLFHLVIEPINIVITLTENTGITFYSLFALATALFIDVGICILNFISVNRCFSEPSASCFDRLYEKSIWFVLASWFVLFDVIELTQMYQLRAQLTEKDTAEKLSREEIKLEKKVPTWNSALVYSNKMRVICLFLILYDLIYSYLLGSLVSDAPMLAVGFSHLFIDGYTYFSANKSLESGTYQVLRAIYVLSAILNFISLSLMVQLSLDSIGIMFSLLIVVTYVVTDMIQILYATRVCDALENYKKFKNSL